MRRRSRRPHAFALVRDPADRLGLLYFDKAAGPRAIPRLISQGARTDLGTDRAPTGSARAQPALAPAGGGAAPAAAPPPSTMRPRIDAIYPRDRDLYDDALRRDADP
jgi:hypothetical protein